MASSCKHAPVLSGGLLSWLTLGIVIVASTATGAPQGRDVRAPSLRRALAQQIPSQGLRISVVLRETDAVATRAARRRAVADRQARVLREATRAGQFTLRHRFRSLNGFSGWATSEAIERLSQHPLVESIYVDGRVHASLNQGAGLVGATQVQDWGVTGAGVAVAVIDSGIDTDHPYLASSIIAEQCYCNDSPNPFAGCCPDGSPNQSGPGAAEDDDGHGTRVAGIISSNQAGRLGVAPGAGIAALKVLDQNGSGNFSDVAAALDWVLTDGIDLGVRVVNVSIGDGIEYASSSASPCSGSNTANAIAQLHAAGVSVFVASGNEGFDAGIAFPACVDEAISVGGTYDASLGTVSWCTNPGCSQTLCIDQNTQPDGFVCHTNSSSLLDFVAPDWKSTTPDLGGGTTNFSGTSAASPYAAGLAALLYEVDPALTPDDVGSLLAMDAPLVVSPDNGLSFPRARVDVALASIHIHCGDGVIDTGEQCDDGNDAPGDCCDSSCQLEPAGSPCDDGTECMSGEMCDGAGSCGGSTPILCEDGDPCTNDLCSKSTGCVFVWNSAPCDDGDACTTDDACLQGSCTGAPLACDDGNECTDDTCDSASGCRHTDNAAWCDDGNACTGGDRCNAGACETGVVLDCSDGNPCTDEWCDPLSGCNFALNTAPCDDGDACTSGDLCSSGVCTSGPALDCDDADPCTADACDELTGCSHGAIAGCSAVAPAETPSLGGWGALALILSLVLTTMICSAVDRGRRLSHDG